jgi:hypothetical protein
MHDAMFHKAYRGLERPEAPAPEPEQGPESESEEAAPPAVETGAVCDEAAAASADWDLLAAVGPVAPVEADVERETKRVVTVVPEAPGTGEAAFAGADLPRSEQAGASDAVSTPADGSGVGAVAADIERETKRVVTVVPEAPAGDAASRVLGEDGGGGPPGPFLEPAAGLPRAGPAAEGVLAVGSVAVGPGG